MPARWRRWNDKETEHLRARYGRVPGVQVGAVLGRTMRKVHLKAGELRIRNCSECKMCGKQFKSEGKGRRPHCSPTCKRAARTARHGRYVSGHRNEANDYQKERKLKNRGRSTPNLAKSAGRFALEELMPRLGFSEFYHASAFNRFTPFDIVATRGGQRVLIDVTTSVSKSPMRTFALALAEALRMPYYVLFIKPDFSKCQLTPCLGMETVQMRLSEFVTIE